MAQGNRSSKPRWGPGESMVTGSTLHSVEKEALAEWLACPEYDRDPDTLKELATKLDVTYRTLANWKKEPAVIAKIEQITGRFVRVEYIPQIINTLHDQATDPSNPRSVSAAKLLLDYASRRADTAPVDLGEATLEELVAMTEDLYDRFTTEAEKTA